MRFLHTSDWHLGRSLHRAELAPAQEAFIDHVVATVRAERVDAVLVAGDIYDRAVPPLESITLFDDALHRLVGAGAAVVLISGNHDSPARLGLNSRLLGSAGVHVRTRVARSAEPVVLGKPGSAVAVYAVPYLEPDAVRADLGPDVGRSHQAVVAAALAHITADRASRDPRPTVVLAHGWVRGGEASDSERDISVGGVGAVSAALFDGVDYVALGHLHRPQVIDEHLRYAGSALPYSFSEVGHRKGSWLVDVDANGLRSVDFVTAPEHRRLSKVSGKLDDLLHSADLVSYEKDFLAVTMLDESRPADAMERLRVRFPHVLTLAWERPGGLTPDGTYRARLAGRADLDVASDFVEHVRGTPTADCERVVLAEAFTAVRVAAGA